jgi:hypothetical protein
MSLKLKKKTGTFLQKTKLLFFNFFSIFNLIFPFTCCHLKLTQSPERYFPRLEAKLKINSKIEIKKTDQVHFKRNSKKSHETRVVLTLQLENELAKIILRFRRPESASARALARTKPSHI